MVTFAQTSIPIKRSKHLMQKTSKLCQRSGFIKMAETLLLTFFGLSITIQQVGFSRLSTYKHNELVLSKLIISNRTVFVLYLLNAEKKQNSDALKRKRKCDLIIYIIHVQIL